MTGKGVSRKELGVFASKGPISDVSRRLQGIKVYMAGIFVALVFTVTQDSYLRNVGSKTAN